MCISDEKVRMKRNCWTKKSLKAKPGPPKKSNGFERNPKGPFFLVWNRKSPYDLYVVCICIKMKLIPLFGIKIRFVINSQKDSLTRSFTQKKVTTKFLAQTKSLDRKFKPKNGFALPRHYLFLSIFPWGKTWAYFFFKRVSLTSEGILRFKLTYLQGT